MLNRNGKFPKNWILCERVLTNTHHPFPRLVLSLLSDYSSTSAINLLPYTFQPSTYSHTPFSHQPTLPSTPAINLLPCTSQPSNNPQSLLPCTFHPSQLTQSLLSQLLRLHAYSFKHFPYILTIPPLYINSP